MPKWWWTKTWKWILADEIHDDFNVLYDFRFVELIITQYEMNSTSLLSSLSLIVHHIIKYDFCWRNIKTNYHSYGWHLCADCLYSVTKQQIFLFSFSTCTFGRFVFVYLFGKLWSGGYSRESMHTKVNVKFWIINDNFNRSYLLLMIQYNMIPWTEG